MKRTLPLAALGLLALGAVADAQSNTNPNIDVELAFIDNFQERGRTGAFPNGLNGFSMSTTICNRGSQIVEWMAAMNPNHPFITFLVARETDGRFEQISDWSYVKHGWFALASSQCTPCTPPPSGAGPYLGLGCSDTYGTGNNGDRYDLGPPAEIDPWLGQWDPNCSHFDLGLSGTTCDGNRSLTNAQVSTYNSIENRIEILDEDLNVPGSTFYYQGFYAVESEGDAVREDNMSSRRINFNWSGSQWNPSPVGSIQHGSILERWSGATVTSNTNGNDDGRVYVGVKVTGPFFGKYHYEYAIHNRDNFRGVGSFSLPKCPDAVITDVGMHHVEDGTAASWTATVNANDVTFDTTTTPLRWNSIFNVWFDSDAAPGDLDLTLGQFDSGPGAATFDVATTGPAKLWNVVLGPGCSNGAGLTLFSNNQATIGNANYKVLVDGGEAGTTQFLFQSLMNGTFAFQGCDIYFGGTFSVASTTTVLNDANLRAIHLLPVPNDVALEGATVNLQAAGIRPSGAPINGIWELSNGLRVRVGDSLTDCP